MDIGKLKIDIDASEIEAAAERVSKTLEELRASIDQLNKAQIHIVESEGE